MVLGVADDLISDLGPVDRIGQVIRFARLITYNQLDADFKTLGLPLFIIMKTVPGFDKQVFNINGGHLDSSINSALVRGSVLKRPRKAEVVVRVSGLRMPRISMHRWRAFKIMPTPFGLMALLIKSET